MGLMQRLFGYDKKSRDIHDQKNQHTAEWLRIQAAARQIRKHAEEIETVAERIAVAAGRVKG